MIHLGTHRLSQDFPEPALLMEVMPSVLARRSFPPPASLACLEPGFRESPDPFFPMALVFLKVTTHLYWVCTLQVLIGLAPICDICAKHEGHAGILQQKDIALLILGLRYLDPVCMWLVSPLIIHAVFKITCAVGSVSMAAASFSS